MLYVGEAGNVDAGPVPRGAGGLKLLSLVAKVGGYGPVPRGAGGLK